MKKREKVVAGFLHGSNEMMILMNEIKVKK